MYCKKCSSSIDDDSAFCQKCGEKQEREIINPINKAAHKPEKSPKWVFPITILLYFLCSNITGNIISLIFPGASPELRSAGSTTSLIFAALGLVVTLLLCLFKCIKPRNLTSNAVCIPIAVLLLEGVKIFGFLIGSNFAQNLGMSNLIAWHSATILCLTTENLYGMNTLWLWGLFIFFLVLYSNATKFKKIHHLIIGVILVAWSFIHTFVTLSRIPAIIEQDPSIGVETFSMLRILCNSYFAWMSLRQFIAYFFIYLAGTKRLGAGGILIFSTAVATGSILLFLICFFILNLKEASVSAFSFGYLFGLIILLAALVRGKTKEKRGEKQTDTFDVSMVDNS